MRPVTIVPIAPQRNQNSASGRMNLVTAGRRSIGIFGTVGAWVKLKYHRWPIHITPLRMCSQRKMKVQKAMLVKSMVVSPCLPLHPEDRNQRGDDDGEDKSEKDCLS